MPSATIRPANILVYVCLHFSPILLRLCFLFTAFLLFSILATINYTVHTSEFYTMMNKWWSNLAIKIFNFEVL